MRDVRDGKMMWGIISLADEAASAEDAASDRRRIACCCHRESGPVTHVKYSSAGLVAFVELPLRSKRVMQFFVFQGLLHRIHGTSAEKEATR